MVKKLLENQNISFGGKWAPNYCSPRYHVAILIPYLNRKHHLQQFLLHMHPIFARQELSYGVYVIEPVANLTFNRGLLLNIGFIESNKDYDNKWKCHAYHDVDMISEDDRTLYSCPESPIHMAHRISKYDYKCVNNTIAWFEFS
jgi:beta-1,4-galactosyltransferase 1